MKTQVMEFANAVTLTYANAGAAISAADALGKEGVVLLADRYGIAMVNIAATTGTGTVAIKGRFNLCKDTADTFTQGQLVWWDSSAKEIIATSQAGKPPIGRVVKAVGTGVLLAQVDLNDFGAANGTMTGLQLSQGASTAAAGSATGDAGVLPAATASVYPTTAADDTAGVRVHADDKVQGRTLFIGNGVSNKILKVYPPTGGTINGAAANAAFSSVSGKGVIMHCLSAASNTWLAW